MNILHRWPTFQFKNILSVRSSLVFDEYLFEGGIFPFGYVESRTENTCTLAFLKMIRLDWSESLMRCGGYWRTRFHSFQCWSEGASLLTDDQILHANLNNLTDQNITIFSILSKMAALKSEKNDIVYRNNYTNKLAVIESGIFVW